MIRKGISLAHMSRKGIGRESKILQYLHYYPEEIERWNRGALSGCPRPRKNVDAIQGAWNALRESQAATLSLIEQSPAR
jgi:hypothetical protein